LSSKSVEIDHPLCAECTNSLIEHLQRKLEETKRERDGYAAFERDVKKSRDAAIAAGNAGNSGTEERKLEQKISRVRAILLKDDGDCH
jgi:beclin 1